MAASVTITLDTTAPAAPAMSIDSGAASTTDVDVSVAITTSDGANPAGYQVKIWGDVDEAFNASIQQDEVDSAWISMASPHAVKLSTGDGVKTLNAFIRDDVFNTTSSVTDSITLDTAAPVPSANAPSPTKISKQATKRTSTFTWSADAIFEEYKVKVVANAGDAHTTGTQIPTTNGSSNVSGSAGGYPAATNITTTVDGADLEAASAGDGAKIVKVFVRDAANNWSV
jgi:hypothetical protein